MEHKINNISTNEFYKQLNNVVEEMPIFKHPNLTLNEFLFILRQMEGEYMLNWEYKGSFHFGFAQGFFPVSDLKLKIKSFNFIPISDPEIKGSTCPVIDIKFY